MSLAPHPFIDALLIAGAVILTVAVLHAYLALNGVRRKLNWAFVLTSVLAAAEAFTAPLRYSATTVASSLMGVKLSTAFIVLCGAAMVWFCRAFAGLKDRKIPAILTALSALLVVVHVSLPNSLRFESAPRLTTRDFAWGETIYILRGKTNPWLAIGTAFGLLVIAYIVSAAVHLWRDRLNSRKALAFSIGVAPFVLFAYPYGVLVNWEFVDPPYYYAFAYLGVVLIMSHTLLSDVLRTSKLAKQVEEDEHRWRSLLENVSLFVLGCDRKGNIEYVNPHLLRVSEYTRDELIGRHFEILVPPSDLAAFPAFYDAEVQRKVPPFVQTGLLTRSGARREIMWSSVLLREADGSLMSMLSVGNDISERLQAEEARDASLKKIAAMKEELESHNQYLKLEYEGTLHTTDILGQSDAIRYVLHKIGQVASTDASVLIEGETGVGKELVARAIHRESSRRNQPFIRVNCASLPSPLIESELFGYEKGAFTGADRTKQGRFELAEGGTLFLDEIGELALDVQAKLLRVLQEGEYDRVGGTKTRHANVRIIAATNTNLSEAVAAGKFREDLYYRVQVFPITVPPLRDRREDIPALTQHFVQRLGPKHGRPVFDVPMAVIRQFKEYDWPGNVRELENVIERAVITSAGPALALPSDFATAPSKAASELPNGLMTMEEMERRYIEQILHRVKGQVAGQGGAAEILGLHPNTLRSRMTKLGVSHRHKTAAV